MRVLAQLASGAQAFKQLAVDAAEAAIAEHTNDVTAFAVPRQVFDDLIDFGQVGGGLAGGLRSCRSFAGSSRSSGRSCSSLATWARTTASAARNASTKSC